MLDGSDSAAQAVGPSLLGHQVDNPLRTRFNSPFDLSFGRTDRGVLLIQARLEDFDTRTTLIYRDSVRVRP